MSVRIPSLIVASFLHFLGAACATYTKIIEGIESAEEGTELAEWRTKVAPRIARSYWKLGEEGSVLDLMYAVRADEAEHRDVNHICCTMEEGGQNPVSNTELQLNTMLLKYVKDIMDKTPEEPVKTRLA
jgi:Alternative oxidase